MICLLNGERARGADMFFHVGDGRAALAGGGGGGGALARGVFSSPRSLHISSHSLGPLCGYRKATSPVVLYWLMYSNDVARDWKRDEDFYSTSETLQVRYC